MTTTIHSHARSGGAYKRTTITDGEGITLTYDLTHGSLSMPRAVTVYIRRTTSTINVQAEGDITPGLACALAAALDDAEYQQLRLRMDAV